MTIFKSYSFRAYSLIKILISYSYFFFKNFKKYIFTVLE